MNNQWFAFFLGTPKRALWTTGVLFVIATILDSGLRTKVLGEVVCLVTGLLQIAIVMDIAVAIWRYITKGSAKKP